MKGLLDKIKADLENNEFWKVKKETPRGAKSILAHTHTWNYVLVEFDIEDQGFPPGSKGYDGTAFKAGTVVHLPRELAELAFKKAKEQEKKNG